MNENRKKIILLCGSGLLFFMSLCLVILGRRKENYVGLGLMLIGVCGVLLLLYLYNRPYNKNMKENKSKNRRRTDEQ